MSKNPRSRNHILPIAMPAEFLVGLSKIQAKYEISIFAAALKLINEGLHLEGVISQEEYSLFNQRYKRKMVDMAKEGRENSHIPKLELEKKKAQERLEGKVESHKFVDYSSFTLEALEKTYQSADYATRNSILFAMKKKGVDIRAYQRQQEGA